MKKILISENEKLDILKKHKGLIFEQTSYHVRDIQTFLNQNGFSLVVDGTLGDDTLKAYNSFLSKNPAKEKYKAPDQITKSTQSGSY